MHTGGDGDTGVDDADGVQAMWAELGEALGPDIEGDPRQVADRPSSRRTMMTNAAATARIGATHCPVPMTKLA